MQVTVGPKVLGHHVFAASVSPGQGWFRVFGVGLHWKDTTRHELNFAERHGHTVQLLIKTWRIGGPR
jgi:hypothetical protein